MRANGSAKCKATVVRHHGALRISCISTVF